MSPNIVPRFSCNREASFIDKPNIKVLNILYMFQGKEVLNLMPWSLPKGCHEISRCIIGRINFIQQMLIAQARRRGSWLGLKYLRLAQGAEMISKYTYFVKTKQLLNTLRRSRWIQGRKVDTTLFILVRILFCLTHIHVARSGEVEVTLLASISAPRVVGIF